MKDIRKPSMFKKIIIHLLIGDATFLFGAVLHYFTKMRDLGNVLAYTGIGYAVISVIIILLKGKLLSFMKKTIKEREKNKAQDELLKYKKLLDEGILSQDEFAKKLEELKKKIL